ncbi:hypothetical protein B0H14DRAFT_3433088 [Mycena olivaceomarginata]|nr:hypothetical protein B0H14DRAFT_3433088 [Mycena olivaceomarginata]
MWYLLTDGEVDRPINFARKALENGMANTPVVFGINIVDTARLKTGGAVYLGRAWHEKHQCFVRIDRLLEQMSPQSIPENELLDLLEDETFKALALSCKTRGLVQNLRDWLLAKYEQPRDMPAIHRPHLENSPLLPRISRCLEKLTALENTGFDVGILEWSSHRSMSAAEAVSSPKVDQEPEVLKAHSSTSTTGAHYATTYTSNAHWSS